MATYEKKGRMTYKDISGDKYVLYPVTKKECVEGMSDIENSVSQLTSSNEGIKSQIGNLTNLTTQAKGTIVAAINELVASSNGNVSTEQVNRLIADYLAANPPITSESDPTVAAAVKTHNEGTNSHSDIRGQIRQLSSGKVNKGGISLGTGSDGLVYIFVDGEPTGVGLSISAKGDVVGYVDGENNIVLTGVLASGTYVLKYENEDGTTTEIGTFTAGTGGGDTGPSYINLVDPTSPDWLTNQRINSSKKIVDITEAQRGDKTYIVTNLIDLAGLSKLHIKGLNILDDYGRMYTYVDGAIHSSTYLPKSGINSKIHYTTADYDSSVTILDVAAAIKDWGYTIFTEISIGGYLTGTVDDIIITADQPIV